MSVSLSSYAAVGSLSYADDDGGDQLEAAATVPDPLAEAPDPLAEAPDPLPADYDDFLEVGVADINSQSQTGESGAQSAGNGQLENQNGISPRQSSPEPKDPHPKR